MSHRHAICLVIDGLRASALGTYGNTIYPTPQLDELASRAVVADWLWADSPQLVEFYQSVWCGQHAARRAARPPEPADYCWTSTILDSLHHAGLRQWLVSDESWLIEQAEHLPVSDALLFDTGAERAAERLEETIIAKFFAQTIERLSSWREEVADSSSLAWLHSCGMFGPWDAPIAMREGLIDDEDPPAAEFIDSPMSLRDVKDPDIVLSHRVAYAAQVAVLDACIGAFVQAVEQTFAELDMLLMLTSSRGFALGEHGAIGGDCMELFSERLHLPWLICPVGSTVPLQRQPALSQPADIGGSLLDWFGMQDVAAAGDGHSQLPLLREEPCTARQLAISVGENTQRAIRTPAWLLRQAEPTAPNLFTKPDDRWECNDVAELCPQVVEALQLELSHCEQCCRDGEPIPIKPQDEELTTPQR